MAWTGLTLTVDGRNALIRAQEEGKLCIKSLVVGDGAPPANFGTQKGLVHMLYELTDLKIDMTEDGCALTADFPVVDYDYYFREIGVVAVTEDGEKLYVYDNCGDDAQYIVSTTGAERTQKRIRLYLTISDVADITVSAPSILYVAYDAYEKDIEELNQKIDILGTNDISGIGDGSVTGAIHMLEEATSNNGDALTALEQAIGTKAEQSEMESALAAKFDKTGGVISGNTTFGSETADNSPQANWMDKNRRVWAGTANGAGDFYLYDATNKKPVIHSDKAGVATFYGNASSATRDENGNNIANTYQKKNGDAKDNTVTYTSVDVADGGAGAWTGVAKLATGEKFSSLFNKISMMFKNVRYLYKMLGTTDISAIGGGTVTGAISKLNTDLNGKVCVLNANHTISEINILITVLILDFSSGSAAYSLDNIKNSIGTAGFAQSAYIIGRSFSGSAIISCAVEGNTLRAYCVSMNGVPYTGSAACNVMMFYV